MKVQWKNLSKKFEKCKIQITIDDAENWTEKLLLKYTNVILEEQNKISLELNTSNEIPDFTRQIIQEGALLYELKIFEGLEEWFMNLTEN